MLSGVIDGARTSLGQHPAVVARLRFQIRWNLSGKSRRKKERKRDFFCTSVACSLARPKARANFWCVCVCVLFCLRLLPKCVTGRSKKGETEGFFFYPSHCVPTAIWVLAKRAIRPPVRTPIREWKAKSGAEEHLHTATYESWPHRWLRTFSSFSLSLRVPPVFPHYNRQRQ